MGLKSGIPLTTMLREQALSKKIKLPTVDDAVKKGFKYYSPEELSSVNIRHKVTIRECLNALVLANPPSQWYSTREGDKTMLIITTYQSYSGGPRNPEDDKYPASRLEVPRKSSK